MVKQDEKQKLDLLLEKGIITPKEYQYLLKSSGKVEQKKELENKNEVSVGGNVVSFILTIIAIIFILFGTCIMNMAILDGFHRSDAVAVVLMVAWPLFPAALFGWLAHKTKNAGMKWAVIMLVIIALLFLASVMS